MCFSAIRRLLHRILGIILSVVFLVTHGVGAYPLTSQKEKNFFQQVLDGFPQELGFINRCDSRIESNKPVVFHILDIHGNTQTQNRIEEIVTHIEAIAEQCSIREACSAPVFVEGGAGEVPLRDFFQRFGDLPASVVDRVFTYLRTRGIVTGGESAAFKAKGGKRLFGLESRPIYELSCRLFLSIRQEQERLVQLCDGIIQASDAKICSKDLREYLSQKDAYAHGDLSAAAMVLFLAEWAQRLQLSDEDLGWLHGFARLIEASNDSDMRGQHLSVESGSTHSSLTSGSWNGWPDLTTIVSRQTVHRIESLQKTIQQGMVQALPEHEREQDQVWLHRRTLGSRLQRIVTLAASREDLAWLSSRVSSGSNDFVRDLDLPEDTRTYLSNCLDRALTFYYLVSHRDKTFADTLEQKMREIETPFCFVITGGFHEKGLQQQLVDDGYQCFSIVPRVEDVVSGEDFYVSRLQQQVGKQLGAAPFIVGMQTLNYQGASFSPSGMKRISLLFSRIRQALSWSTIENVSKRVPGMVHQIFTKYKKPLQQHTWRAGKFLLKSFLVLNILALCSLWAKIPLSTLLGAYGVLWVFKLLGKKLLPSCFQRKDCLLLNIATLFFLMENVSLGWLVVVVLAVKWLLQHRVYLFKKIMGLIRTLSSFLASIHWKRHLITLLIGGFSASLCDMVLRVMTMRTFDWEILHGAIFIGVVAVIMRAVLGPVVRSLIPACETRNEARADNQSDEDQGLSSEKNMLSRIASIKGIGYHDDRVIEPIFIHAKPSAYYLEQGDTEVASADILKDTLFVAMPKKQDPDTEDVETPPTVYQTISIEEHKSNLLGFKLQGVAVLQQKWFHPPACRERACPFRRMHYGGTDMSVPYRLASPSVISNSIGDPVNYVHGFETCISIEDFARVVFIKQSAQDKEVGDPLRLEDIDLEKEIIRIETLKNHTSIACRDARWDLDRQKEDSLAWQQAHKQLKELEDRLEAYTRQSMFLKTLLFEQQMADTYGESLLGTTQLRGYKLIEALLDPDHDLGIDMSSAGSWFTSYGPQSGSSGFQKRYCQAVLDECENFRCYPSLYDEKQQTMLLQRIDFVQQVVQETFRLYWPYGIEHFDAALAAYRRTDDKRSKEVLAKQQELDEAEDKLTELQQKSRKLEAQREASASKITSIFGSPVKTTVLELAMSRINKRIDHLRNSLEKLPQDPCFVFLEEISEIRQLIDRIGSERARVMEYLSAAQQAAAYDIQTGRGFPQPGLHPFFPEGVSTGEGTQVVPLSQTAHAGDDSLDVDEQASDEDAGLLVRLQRHIRRHPRIYFLVLLFTYLVPGAAQGLKMWERESPVASSPDDRPSSNIFAQAKHAYEKTRTWIDGDLRKGLLFWYPKTSYYRAKLSAMFFSFLHKLGFKISGRLSDRLGIGTVADDASIQGLDLPALFVTEGTAGFHYYCLFSNLNQGEFERVTSLPAEPRVYLGSRTVRWYTVKVKEGETYRLFRESGTRIDRESLKKRFPGKISFIDNAYDLPIIKVLTIYRDKIFAADELVDLGYRTVPVLPGRSKDLSAALRGHYTYLPLEEVRGFPAGLHADLQRLQAKPVGQRVMSILRDHINPKFIYDSTRKSVEFWAIPGTSMVGDAYSKKGRISVRCTQNAQIFCILLRAAGVPARVCGGVWDQNADGEGTPDEGHASVEYWDTDSRMWVACDPGKYLDTVNGDGSIRKANFEEENEENNLGKEKSRKEEPTKTSPQPKEYPLEQRKQTMLNLADLRLKRYASLKRIAKIKKTLEQCKNNGYLLDAKARSTLASLQLDLRAIEAQLNTYENPADKILGKVPLYQQFLSHLAPGKEKQLKTLLARRVLPRRGEFILMVSSTTDWLRELIQALRAPSVKLSIKDLRELKRCIAIAEYIRQKRGYSSEVSLAMNVLYLRLCMEKLRAKQVLPERIPGAAIDVQGSSALVPETYYGDAGATPKECTLMWNLRHGAGLKHPPLEAMVKQESSRWINENEVFVRSVKKDDSLYKKHQIIDQSLKDFTCRSILAWGKELDLPFDYVIGIRNLEKNIEIQLLAWDWKQKKQVFAITLDRFPADPAIKAAIDKWFMNKGNSLSFYYAISFGGKGIDARLYVKRNRSLNRLDPTSSKPRFPDDKLRVIAQYNGPCGDFEGSITLDKHRRFLAFVVDMQTKDQKVVQKIHACVPHNPLENEAEDDRKAQQRYDNKQDYFLDYFDRGKKIGGDYERPSTYYHFLYSVRKVDFSEINVRYGTNIKFNGIKAPSFLAYKDLYYLFDSMIFYFTLMDPTYLKHITSIDGVHCSDRGNEESVRYFLNGRYHVFDFFWYRNGQYRSVPICRADGVGVRAYSPEYLQLVVTLLLRSDLLGKYASDSDRKPIGRLLRKAYKAIHCNLGQFWIFAGRLIRRKEVIGLPVWEKAKKAFDEIFLPFFSGTHYTRRDYTVRSIAELRKLYPGDICQGTHIEEKIKDLTEAQKKNITSEHNLTLLNKLVAMMFSACNKVKNRSAKEQWPDILFRPGGIFVLVCLPTRWSYHLWEGDSYIISEECVWENMWSFVKHFLIPQISAVHRDGILDWIGKSRLKKLGVWCCPEIFENRGVWLEEDKKKTFEKLMHEACKEYFLSDRIPEKRWRYISDMVLKLFLERHVFMMPTDRIFSVAKSGEPSPDSLLRDQQKLAVIKDMIDVGLLNDTQDSQPRLDLLAYIKEEIVTGLAVPLEFLRDNLLAYAVLPAPQKDVKRFLTDVFFHQLQGKNLSQLLEQFEEYERVFGAWFMGELRQLFMGTRIGSREVTSSILGKTLKWVTRVAQDRSMKSHQQWPSFQRQVATLLAELRRDPQRTVQLPHKTPAEKATLREHDKALLAAQAFVDKEEEKGKPLAQQLRQKLARTEELMRSWSPSQKKSPLESVNFGPSYIEHRMQAIVREYEQLGQQDSQALKGLFVGKGKQWLIRGSYPWTKRVGFMVLVSILNHIPSTKQGGILQLIIDYFANCSQQDEAAVINLIVQKGNQAAISMLIVTVFKKYQSNPQSVFSKSYGPRLTGQILRGWEQVMRETDPDLPGKESVIWHLIRKQTLAYLGRKEWFWQDAAGLQSLGVTYADLELVCLYEGWATWKPEEKKEWMRILSRFPKDKVWGMSIKKDLSIMEFFGRDVFDRGRKVAINTVPIQESYPVDARTMVLRQLVPFLNTCFYAYQKSGFEIMQQQSCFSPLSQVVVDVRSAARATDWFAAMENLRTNKLNLDQVNFTYWLMRIASLEGMPVDFVRAKDKYISSLLLPIAQEQQCLQFSKMLKEGRVGFGASVPLLQYTTSQREQTNRRTWFMSDNWVLTMLILWQQGNKNALEIKYGCVRGDIAAFMFDNRGKTNLPVFPLQGPIDASLLKYDMAEELGIRPENALRLYQPNDTGTKEEKEDRKQSFRSQPRKQREMNCVLASNYTSQSA